MKSCRTGRKTESENCRTSFVPSLLAWAGLATLTFGCAVGPNFVKPEAPPSEAWVGLEMPPSKTGAAEEGTGPESPGIKSGVSDYSAWWKTFGDPVLDTLVENAYHQNLPLQIAGIRIMESRAQLGIAIGNLYPQRQVAFGEYAANRLSENAGVPVIERDYQSLSAGFDAAWELDVWGKFRRSVESQTASLGASVASYDDVLVSLVSEVARTYIVIRTLELQLEIARENVRIQDRSLAIANARFQGGDVSELDVAQARGLLRDTQASIPSFEGSLQQVKNALAILLGGRPGEFESQLKGPARIPEVSEEVVVDIPADLLRRRPDIRLAELRVAAQSPQIGVAKADLYPSFALAGTIGWQTTDASTVTRENSLNDMFESESLFWAAGPAFEWNIFNYGRIQNRVRAEDARLQQLVVEYKNTVLQAYREVEDAMAAFVRSREEKQFLQESVDAAKRSVDIALIQYREGLVDFQRVLDTQRFLASQANRLTAVSGSLATDLVAMYKALGGGWQIRKGKDFISPEIQEEMKSRTRWGGLLRSKELEGSETLKKGSGWRLPDW